MYTEVGRQVARFAMRGGKTMFLFTFGDTLEDQKSILRERFGDAGWECPAILSALDSASDFYFDTVSQVRMGLSPGAWHRGRIALIGDAASCISLVGGQGSALAMTAAYLLGYELAHCHGDHEAAFRAYEQSFGPFVLRKQDAALRFGGFFVPHSPFSIFLRNVAIKAMNLPFVANLAAGRDLADRISLPGL
jgi:2-polyprenyl-6-methoxyphenol hydroxylase-like FAD-dependent oxidoreductase